MWVAFGITFGIAFGIAFGVGTSRPLTFSVAFGSEARSRLELRLVCVCVWLRLELRLRLELAFGLRFMRLEQMSRAFGKYVCKRKGCVRTQRGN